MPAHLSRRLPRRLLKILNVSTRKPVIGIPADRRLLGRHYFHCVGEKYIRAVAEGAQAMPVLIPSLGDALNVRELLADFDGILLTGSPSNVEPHHYSGPPSDPGTLHDAHRDATTLPLIPHVVEGGMPLLAICRGFQEMNVAFGGTLWQKLHEVEGLRDHREDLKAPLEEQYGPAHEIELTRGGVLQRLAGNDRDHREFAAFAGRADARARPRDRGACPGRRRRGIPRAQCAVVRRSPCNGIPSGSSARTHFPSRCSRPSARRPASAPRTIERASSMSVIQQFFKEHGISEVEAIIPDMAGVPRGKIMPAAKFAEEEGMRLPESIFLQTVTGEYPDDERAISPSEIDIVLKADPNTIRVVPWAAEPTAQVIHDSFYSDGRPVTMAPRYVLQHVLELYAQHGWEPVVAPELEFFLVEPNIDSDYPLKPPIGRSGRPEIGRQSYSIAAVNEFDPLFDDMYAFCEAQDIEIDTLIHEDGAAQMEINLLHGNALSLADQVFLFKRTAREAALRHKMYATFMAKPMAREPGSAMHMHQSIVDRRTGNNIFSDAEGRPSPLFFSHIAGLQKYLPAAMSLFAPNVNSYRRITRHYSAPINSQWGYDNRTAGLRVPVSSPASRRVENRIAGADANPYLVDRRVARLRLSRHGRGAEALRADLRQRLRPAVLAAAEHRGFAAPVARLAAADRHPRRALRDRLRGGQGERIRDVPAGDQLLGTRAPATERLTEAMHYFNLPLRRFR